MSGTDPIAGADAAADLDFEEGRYLYCAVRADEGSTFEAEGIEGVPVSLVVTDGVGAVVQPVDSPYDTDDLAKVREWLLSHQRVVDAAGDAFGTPLPFRFDTIIRGDDATVAEWIEGHAAEIGDALSSLAGRWEYRVEVRWDEEAVADEIREIDDDLRALDDRIEEASEGTAYLLESQYESRLSERLESHRRDVEAELLDRLEPHAVEVRRPGEESGLLSEERDDRGSSVRLSLLARREDEEIIGEQLEPFADREHHEVRYTGPWPPYGFAPKIGGDDGE